MIDPEKLCNRFTARLHTWVGQIRATNANPKETDWIEKLLVFFALEDCRDIFNDSERLYCRFSMGLSGNDDKKRLQLALKEARATERDRKYAIGSVDRLKEFLVDFSMSRTRIDNAISTTGVVSTKTERFEFLIAAESEMGNEEDVLYDLLKLPCVYASVKIMVFKVIDNEEARGIFCRNVEHVLNTSRREDDSATWLFVGIPPYKLWLDNFENTENLPMMVHTLSDSGKLVARKTWWKWQ